MASWKDDEVVGDVQEPTTSSSSWRDDEVISEEDTSGYEGGPAVDLSVPPKVAPLTMEQQKANEQPDGFISESGIPMGNAQENVLPYDVTKGEQEAYQRKQYVTSSGDPNEDYETQVDKITLPEDFVPTTDMYEGITDPHGFYDYIKSKSEGTSVGLSPTYRNPKTGKLYTVPAPGDYHSGEQNKLESSTITGSNWFTNDMADAARMAAKNLAVTAAAGLDSFTEGTQFETRVAETIDKVIANPAKATNIRDSLLREGAVLTAGAIAGSKVGKKIAPADMPKLSAISAYFFGLVGSVAVMDPDTETTMTGQNSLSAKTLGHPLWDGIKVDEGMSSAKKILAKKFNLLSDAMLAAAPVEAATKGVSLGVRFAKAITWDAITPIFSDKAKGTTVFKEAAMKLGAGTPDQIDDLIEHIRKNKEEVIDFMDSNIPDMPVERTTMSAIAEGADDRALQIKAMEAEKGVLETGASQLRTKMEQPVNALRDTQKSLLDSRGGLDAVEGARDQMFRQAQEAIGDSTNEVVTAGLAADAAEESLVKTLTEDKNFGKQIQELSANTGIDVLGRDKTAASGSISKKIATAITKAWDDNNALYEAIPDTAPVEMQSFMEKLTDAWEFLPPSTKKQLSSVIDLEDPAQELTFKYVNNEVLPKINSAINMQMKSANPNVVAIEALTDLRKNIASDQLEILSQNGDSAIAEAALAAKNNYKNNIAKFADDPKTPMGKLFAEHGQYFRGKRADRPYDIKTGWRDTSQPIIEGLSDKKAGGAEQLITFMKSPNYMGDPKEIIEVYKGNVSRKLAGILSNTDDVTQINPGDILSSIGDVGVTLQKEFPEQAAEMTQLLNDVRTKKITLEQAKNTLKEVMVKADEAEKRVYDSILGKFIQQSPDPMKPGIVPATNGYKIFGDMLSNPGSEAQIAAVMDRVRKSNDPIAQKGIEAAFFSHVEDLLKGANNQGFNVKAAEDLLSDKNPLWKYGEEIIQNKDLAAAYKGAIRSVLKEHTKRVPGSLSAMPSGTPLAKARQGFDTFTTWTFGVLNSTATKVRSAGSKVLMQNDPAEQINGIRDLFYSDPDFAIKSLTELRDELKYGMTPKGRDMMFRIGLRAGIYSDKEKPAWEEETKKMFSQGLLQKAKVPEGVSEAQGRIRGLIPPKQ